MVPLRSGDGSRRAPQRHCDTPPRRAVETLSEFLELLELLARLLELLKWLLELLELLERFLELLELLERAGSETRFGPKQNRPTRLLELDSGLGAFLGAPPLWRRWPARPPAAL